MELQQERREKRAIYAGFLETDFCIAYEIKTFSGAANIKTIRAKYGKKCVAPYVKIENAK